MSHTKQVASLMNIYHIAQNSGGVKLWQISDFKVLARKTLANAQHLYYWQEINFGESEGESLGANYLSLSKADILSFWFLTFYKKLFNTDFEGLTC